MSTKKPIIYGALMLTAVNLMLRFVSTSFQVYLSSVIGPAGVGLLQLVLSVNGLALTAGLAGIRTAAMYLTAEELGRGHPDNAAKLLGGCCIYSIAVSGIVSIGLYLAAPIIAQRWIGSLDALRAIRTFSAFLPVICLCGVMTGYFTAANRIGTLAAVEVAEQCVVMAVTVIGLNLMSGNGTSGCCQAVVIGSGSGAVMTLAALLILYIRSSPNRLGQNPTARRICTAAVPLALADDLKAGITTVENLLVPRRLGLYAGVSNPLAAFGIVSGMVFPVMMFPAAILFSLAEMLIPELARCAAVGSGKRIRYLLKRNLRITLLYGLLCGGILFLIAEPLCARLYPGVEVAAQLRRFCLLVPMLYCDLIVDGMTKGLGQQRYCVRYSIISNTLDVALLFVLLPRFGVDGYFASFLVTHLLNFLLSLRRLLLCGGIRIRFWYPAMAVAAALLSVLGASWFMGISWQIAAFCVLYFCLCYLFGVVRSADLQWLRGMIFPPSEPKTPGQSEEFSPSA